MWVESAVERRARQSAKGAGFAASAKGAPQPGDNREGERVGATDERAEEEIQRRGPQFGDGLQQQQQTYIDTIDHLRQQLEHLEQDKTLTLKTHLQAIEEHKQVMQQLKQEFSKERE
ncbi:hypothetical protein RFI_21538, partial [Reticulomyxa filosa]